MSRTTHGRDVVYERVAVGELHFDPSNPRFARPGDPPATDPSIQALLEKEPHIALNLVDSFLENGFIAYEPLVVRRRSNGGYFVVEGNRRLAAIRHILSNPAKYKTRSEKIASLANIPVLIFPDAGAGNDQKNLRIYLGVRHLFGFRDWPADSKARFLNSVINSAADLTLTARELNIKKQEIARYLVPFRLREKARDLWEPHKDQDFWVLGESLNRTGIKSYLVLDVDRGSLTVRSFDKERLRKLLVFIYGSPEKQRKDRRIQETRQLSDLAKVLASRPARAALERGHTLDEAYVLIETPDEIVTRLQRLVAELDVVMKVLGKRSGTSNLTIRFEYFRKAARQFATNAKKSGL